MQKHINSSLSKKKESSMKKFSFVLAAIFAVSAASAFAQNENAELETGIEISASVTQETSAPVAAPVTTVSAQQPAVESKAHVNEPKTDILTDAQKKESKQNADMIRKQAKDLVNKAKTAKKKADADAKVIKNQAKNDEKTVLSKVATMKEKAAAEKKHSDSEAKALEDRAKSIREAAKNNQKETLNDANAMAQKAKETREAAFKRADDLVSIAAQDEKEAQRQADLLLQSIPK